MSLHKLFWLALCTDERECPSERKRKGDTGGWLGGWGEERACLVDVRRNAPAHQARTRGRAVLVDICADSGERTESATTCRLESRGSPCTAWLVVARQSKRVKRAQRSCVGAGGRTVPLQQDSFLHERVHGRCSCFWVARVGAVREADIGVAVIVPEHPDDRLRGCRCRAGCSADKRS